MRWEIRLYFRGIKSRWHDSGIGCKSRKKLPNCKVIGVDPYGSILAFPDDLNRNDVTTSKVEGTGYDFVPKVLDRRIVDQWIKIGDDNSLPMTRRLINSVW